MKMPESSLTWKLLLACLICVRLASAVLLPIMDCDETYNYWEPLHRLMYGYGFQTWEYAPNFALRSYFYLWLHAILGWPFTKFLTKKYVFFALRMVFALISSYAEMRFAKQTSAPFLTLWFLICSPGMFQAASAFLPSSFVMICMFLVLANRSHLGSVVIGIGLATLLGWPFAALLGAPYALAQLYQKPKPFLRMTLLTFLVISVPMFLVDSYMYGEWQFAPLNLLRYNLLENKSALYGVESASFYYKNLLLNWTLVVPLASAQALLSSATDPWSWSPALWLAVLLAQPHKEERFLFPVYPWLAWAGAAALRQCPWRAVRAAVGLAVAAVSALRIAALVAYYTAPMRLDLAAARGIVCLGHDWHLFPGHFFVPRSVRLGFAPMRAGELPDLFDEAPLPNATRKTVHFNGMNINDPNRFKLSYMCDYYIGTAPIEENVTPLQCVPFLDNSNTRVSFRVLYHTYTTYQTWKHFCLYRNNYGRGYQNTS